MTKVQPDRQVTRTGVTRALAAASASLRVAGVTGVRFTDPNGWDETPKIHIETARPVGEAARFKPDPDGRAAVEAAIAGLERAMWRSADGTGLVPIDPDYRHAPPAKGGGDLIWPPSRVLHEVVEPKRAELLARADRMARDMLFLLALERGEDG